MLDLSHCWSNKGKLAMQPLHGLCTTPSHQNIPTHPSPQQHLHTHIEWSQTTQQNGCDNITTTMVWLQSSTKLVKGGPVSCYSTSTTKGSAFLAPTFHLGVSFRCLYICQILVIKHLEYFTWVFHSLSIRVSSHRELKPPLLSIQSLDNLPLSPGFIDIV